MLCCFGYSQYKTEGTCVFQKGDMDDLQSRQNFETAPGMGRIVSPQNAYVEALIKVCQSLTVFGDGAFREVIILNEAIRMDFNPV